MTANMNFNPEWMRSETLPKRTSASIGHRPDFLGSYVSSPQTPTMSLGDELSQNPFKYSKNFMLNLYNPLAIMPDDFEHHEHVVVEESQGPLAFVELSEGEKKLLSGAVHSEPSRRGTNNSNMSATEKSSSVQRSNRDFFASPLHSPASEHAPMTPSRSTMRPKGRVDDYFSRRSENETSKLRELSSSSSDLHETLWGANGSSTGDNVYPDYQSPYAVGNGLRYAQSIMNDPGARNGLYQGAHEAMGFNDYSFQDQNMASLGGAGHSLAPRWYYLDKDQIPRGPYEDDHMRALYANGYLPSATWVRREDDSQFERLSNSLLQKSDSSPTAFSGGVPTNVAGAHSMHSAERLHHGSNSFNLFGARGDMTSRGVGTPLASPYRFDATSPSPEFFSQTSNAPLRSPLPPNSLASFSSNFPRESAHLPRSPSWTSVSNQNMPFGMPQQSPLFSAGLSSPGVFEFQQTASNPYDQYAALQQKHAMPFRQPTPSTPGRQSTPGTPGIAETPFSQWMPTAASALPVKITEERLQSRAPGQQSPRIPRSPQRQPTKLVVDEVGIVTAAISDISLEEPPAVQKPAHAPTISSIEVKGTEPVASAPKPVSLREIQAEEMKKQEEIKQQQMLEAQQLEQQRQQDEQGLDSNTLSLSTSKLAMRTNAPAPLNSSAWGREPVSNKGPSLKEIQELEAREAKAKAKIAAEKPEAVTQSSMFGRESPLTLSWGVVVPNNKTAASLISSPSTPTTPAWGSTTAPKKTLREIQLEEEAVMKRKANARAASSSNSMTTMGSQGYASALGSVKGDDQSGWTTVTSARLASKAVAPVTTAAFAPSKPAPATRTVATTVSMTTTRSATVARSQNANEEPKVPSDEFRRWCRMSLRDLNPDVDADDFLQILLSFPLDKGSAEIIQDIIYANSTSMDGRRFADEFMQRKRADMAGNLRVPVTTQDDASTFQVVKKKGKKRQPQA